MHFNSLSREVNIHEVTPKSILTLKHKRMKQLTLEDNKSWQSPKQAVYIEDIHMDNCTSYINRAQEEKQIIKNVAMHICICYCFIN